MNYRDTNIALLTGDDVYDSFVKDQDFYDYLLGNNVAYYYASNISTKKTVMDKKIIRVGNILNNKYIKTLELINTLCKENNIKFLLFKTYKYIPEVIDNDIDLLIKKKDFYHFMKVLQNQGFECIENEPLKGICKKDGFCTIEPRTNSSFHGLTIMDEHKLWEKYEIVNVGGMRILKVIKEFEIIHLLLSILYNPNYLRFYLLIIYRGCNVKNLHKTNLEKHVLADLKLVINDLIKEGIEVKRFPLFLGNIKFISWWYKRILNSRLNRFTKFKHLIYFFYLKYSYILFDKLIFIHKWPLNYETK